MTGLNLETFLHLLRADFGAWASVGLVAAVLALMTWTSWGSRRALRKCLVLSIIAHAGLALYGGTVPVALTALHPADEDGATRDHIRQIKVEPTALDEAASGGGSGKTSARSKNGLGGGGGLAPWDKTFGGLALADVKLTAPKTAAAPDVAVRPGDRPELDAAAATPETETPAPPAPEARPDEQPKDTTPAPPRVTPAGGDEVAPAVVADREEPAADAGGRTDSRLRPERTAPASKPDAPTERRLPAAPPSLTVPDAPGSAPVLAEPVVAREEEAKPTAGEPAPPAAAEIAAKDVAPVEVIPARPDAPRLGAGDANLRTRSRPGTGSGGTGRPSTRPSLAMALPSRPGPTLEGPALEAPAALSERPVSSDVGGGNGNGNGGGTGPAIEAARPAAPGENEVGAVEVVKPQVAPLPRVAAPESDVRRRARPDAVAAPPALAMARRPTAPSGGLSLPRVTPNGVPALPEIQGAAGGRPLGDVPEVYRSRLDPNRSARAFRSGASPASEQAVERALDWLARHQDTDGRWDAATAKYDDGTPVKGDDDFTVHCPAGEPCFGECIYWEADTALTGLALLSYLGAGYTQTDGKYAETVGKGLDFLLAQQKPDGDLRGRSRAVGMYCHAMATIALCEAYALTGDERLRAPVERAVGFIARSRARDSLAWRYAPGAPVGDTSILGWVVMALKSAREVGIAVPSSMQTGTLGWLSKVSSGESNGLARYQPQDAITPTMTAEAWVCRQFLGVGGPGPASSEAAEYLLDHGPKSDAYNLYYWYYGTLAMYQHGGDAWYRWNALVRDEIVRRQRPRGHAAGSWDPDDSPYGAKGGRIYCTALATLSLEVYYRYLRLYDEPNIPPAVAPGRPRGGNGRDPAVGRRTDGRVPVPAQPRR